RNHHSRDLHDPERLAAGFMKSLDIRPPKVRGHEYREKDCELIRRNLKLKIQQDARFVDQSPEILARTDAADRTGENVIEKKCRHGKPRDEWPHRVAHHDVYAAAHEHAAAFHVDRANGEAEQHDAENEPRSASADRLLGNAARVIDARSKIAENDGGRTPERNE